MWNADYLVSLGPLGDTLHKMVPGTHLERVSMVTVDNTGAVDLSKGVYLVHCVLSVLEHLEEDGFFVLLDNIRAIERLLKIFWNQASYWREAQVIDRAREILAPILGKLSRRAPSKVHDILVPLKSLLEKALESDQYEQDCVLLLSRIQQDFEEVRPMHFLDYLLELDHMLTAQHRDLAWLESHPVLRREAKRRPDNVLTLLKVFRKNLGYVLPSAHKFLREMRCFLVYASEIQAVVENVGALEA
ncbi:uncharacterized protein LOC128352542 [Hemicordylus capensis]|uniref:uncharacterized protein LOC128352542 n=1 Tax=Hemicordylus capensis TaxID=884348 RepID=UPI002304A648|nr:uncharacterized protein LOC128352542 [Hemicordylus capensis]